MGKQQRQSNPNLTVTDDEFLPEGQKPGLLWCVAVYLSPLPPSSDDPLPGRTPLTFPPAPETISKPPFPKAANPSLEKLAVLVKQGR